METNNFLPKEYKNYNTCLTINTDASFCPTTRAGGYAFWAVCDNFVYKYGNILKEKIDNPTEAEIKAVANAVFLILKKPGLPKLKHIVINTDSKGCIRHIQKRNTPDAIIAANLLDVLAFKTQPQDINFRWVKSHSGTTDKRSKVNDWCDQEAKKFMRLQRNQFKKAIK